MTEPTTAVDVAAAVAGGAAPAFAKIFDDASRTLARKVSGAARSLIDKTIADLQIGFSEYLQTSYDKTRLVKTLLNPFKPMEVLDLYVNVELETDGIVISDIDLVQKLNNYKRVVITGLAGSGKSMFMRYLTLARFENPRGMIPLFVELRQMNSLEVKDLIYFIHYACTSGNNKVSHDQFDIALRAGSILLVLDGFDEIDEPHRDVIERQILDLQIRYPDLVIAVSGRPDNRFAAWSSFYVFKVREFTQAQTLRLIDNIDYEVGLKRRFSREIKTKLWKTHKSFLEYPLLVTIMLLTYEQFADIPDKVHVFYGQAFDTLFQRHDAQKAQYVRKTYSGLAIDDFKNCLAAFCLFSYMENTISFLDEEIVSTAEQAINYSKAAIDKKRFGIRPDDFIRDLRECVCLLQRDGIHTAFVHRSFQEYFVAVFVASMHDGKVGKLLHRLGRRSQDSVMSLALEMAREKVEQEWVLPTLSKLVGRLTEANGNVSRQTQVFFDAVVFDQRRPDETAGFARSTESLYNEMCSLKKMYPSELSKVNTYLPFSVVDFDKLRQYVSDHPELKKFDEFRSTMTDEEIENADSSDTDLDDDHLTEFHFEDSDVEWMYSSSIAEGFDLMLHGFKRLQRDVANRNRRRESILSDIL